MKKTKKLCILLATLALGVATAGLTACDEVYTTAQTDELIASLQTKIDTNKAELDEKIVELANKIAELEEATRIVGVAFADNGDLIITFGDGSKQTVEAPKQHEHTFGSWTAFTSDDAPCESRLFFRVCDDCHSIEWKQGSYDDHAWDIVTTPPTCKAQGYDTKNCTICGKVEITNYTAIVAHSFNSEYSFDNSYHWYACATCDETKDKKEHTVQASGECSVCHEVVGATEGVYYEIKNGIAKVVGYDGTATRVRLADTYNGAPVTSIGASAFADNYTIREVILPDTITIIESNAFLYSSLESIVLSNNLQTIEDGAFSISNLESIDIPNSVTKIGSGVFEMTCLKSITIPSSVVTMDGSFMLCSSLTSVVINEGVTNINGTFGGTGLIDIIIPDSVTTIGKFAFGECWQLTNVVVGSGIEKIDEQAFINCDQIKNVYYKGTANDWATIEIKNYNSRLTSAKRYYYIENAEDLPTDNGYYWHYDEQGNIVIW